MSSDQSLNLVYLLLLLTFLGSSFVLHFKSRPGTTLKQLSIWLIIIIGLVILYSFRFEFKNIKDRLIGELLPSHAIEKIDGSVQFRQSRDGHFHINAQINRKDIEFLVDTGASDVVLSPQDAKKLGYRQEGLEYTKIYNTANGTVTGAPVRIDNLKIGHIIMNDVRASVNSAPMDKSLLGMSFLQRLNGYEVRDETLTLWP